METIYNIGLVIAYLATFSYAAYFSRKVMKKIGEKERKEDLDFLRGKLESLVNDATQQANKQDVTSLVENYAREIYNY